MALINALYHIKRGAAPETKAATERARLLIEQAEALGEPLEDPLLLFTVLYSFVTASYFAFNGDLMRELAAQFLMHAEKHWGVSSVGPPLAHGGTNMNGPEILRLIRQAGPGRAPGAYGMNAADRLVGMAGKSL